MTKTDRLKTLANAAYCVEQMHGSVVGSPDHIVEAKKCECVFGETLRRLAVMKREVKLQSGYPVALKPKKARR